MGSRTSPQARLLFKDAFDSLEQTINASNPEDARVLQNTTLQDVHDAARKLEQELGARQCLRNMARVVPFLEALEHYSNTVDVLCNGTPYLPFIWAPIKLILRVWSLQSSSEMFYLSFPLLNSTLRMLSSPTQRLFKANVISKLSGSV